MSIYAASSTTKTLESSTEEHKGAMGDRVVNQAVSTSFNIAPLLSKQTRVASTEPPKMNTPFFNPFTCAAIEAALSAKGILQEGFGSQFSIQEKAEGVQNLLTEYDLKVDQAIMNRIQKRFPDHGFLTEESAQEKDQFTLPEAPVVWIIDAIDGTRNFANNIGIFSVSIAAFDTKLGKIVSSAIVVPMLNEIFVAERGKGAYLNRQRIEVSKQSDFSKSLLSTGFPYTVRENPLNCVEIFSGLIKTGIPIKDLGSSVIHLAYVAAGKFDICWHAELQPWDFAAASLLIEEAGGTISDWDGNPLNITKASTLVASNGILHQTMLDQIKLLRSS